MGASGRPALGGLTARELEVARLIAQGMTNREVAARLQIAQRTAVAHVEHIMAKLGFASRVEIAVWMLQNDRAAADAREPTQE